MKTMKFRITESFTPRADLLVSDLCAELDDYRLALEKMTEERNEWRDKYVGLRNATLAELKNTTGLILTKFLERSTRELKNATQQAVNT